MAIRISGDNAVSTKPTKPDTSATTTGWFSDDSQSFTSLTPHWCNEVQAEINGAINDHLGASPDYDDQTQLSQVFDLMAHRNQDNTFTGKITLDMSDSEDVQAPLVSADYLDTSRSISPSAFVNKGVSEKLEALGGLDDDKYGRWRGWFYCRDFDEEIGATVSGTRIHGPNLSHQDLCLAWGNFGDSDYNPTCYFPLPEAADNKWIHDLWIYALNYDAVSTRGLTVSIESRAVTSTTWISIDSWSFTLPVATAGGSTMVYDSGGSVYLGDYFFNSPSTYTGHCVLSSDYEMQESTLYRVKVVVTDQPGTVSIGGVNTYNPFGYVGLSGLKIEYRQKRFVV